MGVDQHGEIVLNLFDGQLIEAVAVEITESAYGAGIEVTGAVRHALQTKGLEMALVEFIESLTIGSSHGGIA